MEEKIKFIKISGINIPIEVLEKRELFGRTDVYVRPINGGKPRWVREENIFINQDDEIKCASGM